MRRRRTGALVVALLTGLGGLAVAAPASGATLSCGQTITQSTVLENDVGPCSNYGIIIGADGITLDLNGHHVFGTPGPTRDGAGVYLQNRTGVTVRNGTVRNFSVGVAIDGGANNTVTGVTARDNIGGLGDIGGDGIAIMSSRGNRIIGNSANNNGPFSGIGLYSRRDPDHPGPPGVARDNLVQGNQVVGNIISRDRATPQNTDNDGIRVENDAVFNTFSDNFVARNGLDGIALFADTADNVVRNNSVEGNGFYRTTARRGSGIIVFTRSTRNVVENNLVTGNADSGIDIRPPLANFPGATNNRIVNNTAVGNSVLPFIPSPVFGESFDLKDGNPNCDANFWFANRYRTFNQPCVTTGGQQV